MEETQCIQQGYELKSYPNETEHNIKVVNKTGTKSVDSIKINLTLITTNPYKTILLGDVILNLELDNPIQVDIKNENTRYCNVVLTNTSTKDKNVNISIDSSEFQLETSNNEVKVIEKDQTGNINKINIILKSANQTELILFKKKGNSSCLNNAISYDIQN